VHETLAAGTSLKLVPEIDANAMRIVAERKPYRHDGELRLHKDALSEASRLGPRLRKSMGAAGWNVGQVNLGVPGWIASW
jgi:hypothetical protein